MEQIFWVENGELDEVNELLQKGGKVKSIHTVSETISAYGFKSNNLNTYDNNKGYYVGDIYAYIVIEFD